MEVKKRNLSINSGFTLAEVLVTLTVIGVIAALTIPTLLQSTGKQEYVTGLKKSYSTLSQAFGLLAAENGGDISTVFNNSDSGANAMNAFANKLSVIKNCGSGLGCFYDTERKWLNGNITDAKLDTAFSGSYGKAILADGSMVLIDDYSGACSYDAGSGPLDNTCGTLSVDINGTKGPNTAGRDYFPFWITKTGLYPRGSNNDGQTCEPTTATGPTNWGCTAKIISEGAMNY